MTSQALHLTANRGHARTAMATRIAAVLLLAVTFFHVAGATAAQAAPAAPKAAAPAALVPQSVGSCPAWWTCTIYFSKTETRDWGNMRFPAAPADLPWQFKVAYWGATSGLAWFAKQYANRGWCSGYKISLVPWDSQGYYGYGCNWN